MYIQPIRNDADHAKAIKDIEAIWCGQAPEVGTPEADRLEVLGTLVDAYETRHHNIDAPTPMDAILFRMEQQGLSRADLIPMIGSRSRVSEVLAGKRTLTLPMVNRLRFGLDLPADLLLGSYILVEEGKRLGSFGVLTSSGGAAGEFYVEVSDSGPVNEMGDQVWRDDAKPGLLVKHSTFLRSPITGLVDTILAAAIPVVQGLLGNVAALNDAAAAKRALSIIKPSLRKVIERERRQTFDSMEHSAGTAEVR